MKIYKLKHPIKAASGATIAEVSIRRLKVRDLKRSATLGGNETLQGLNTLGLLCENLTPEDYDELDAEDLRGLSEEAKDFLQAADSPPAKV